MEITYNIRREIGKTENMEYKGSMVKGVEGNLETYIHKDAYRVKEVQDIEIEVEIDGKTQNLERR